MRKNRIIFCILWILSLVGISLYGGPISYGFFYGMTLLPIISALYLLCVNLRFGIYQRLESNRPVSNQTVPFYFTLKNDDSFPFVGVRVRFFSDFSMITGLEDGLEYELLPHTGIDQETGLICKYRGEYEVGIQSVETTDFFRLLRFTYRNPETLRVVVKPELISLEVLRCVEDVRATSKDSRHNASRADVTVRLYEPGDDIRRIHQKLSASSGQLMIRNMIGEEQEGIGILLSTHRLSDEMRVYLPVENKLLEVVLALSYYFVRKNMPVSVEYRREKREEIKGSNLQQFQMLYDQISELSFRKDYEDKALFTDASKTGVIFRNRMVFFVVSEWKQETEAMVQMLNGNGIPVVVCLVTDDDIPIPPATNRSMLQIVKLSTDASLKEVL